MGKIKLLFILPGIHHNIRPMLSELGKNWDIHVLRIHGLEDSKDTNLIENVKIHEITKFKKIKILTSRFFIPSFNQFKKELLNNYDCVIFKNLFDTLSLIGFWICKQNNQPFIFSEQKIKKPSGLYGLAFNLIKNIYLKRIIKIKNVPSYASTGIAYKQLKEYTKKRYYIPFAIDADNYNIHKFEDKNILHILNVGTFQKRKDQTLLISAIKKLKLKYPNIIFDLTFIGGHELDGNYKKEFEDFAKNSKIQFKIIDKIPTIEMQSTYEKYDLFVLPSYDEPAAFSPLEAMVSGLPVICSDENGTSNYIKNGKNGCIFKARNASSLSSCIEKIAIKNRTINWSNLKRLGSQSRILALENHSPKKIFEKIKKMLKDNNFI